MLIRNTSDRYGLLAILLHWTIAVLIIGMLCLGLYMTDLPVSPLKLKLYGLHKAFGVLVLMLALIRIMWSLSNMTPQLSSYLPTWQKLAARSVHFAFYIFMLLMPITGWLMSSAAGFPVSFFGLFTLPDLIAHNEKLRVIFAEIHEFSAFALIAAIVAHVGATVQHYVIYKENVIKRMWP